MASSKVEICNLALSLISQKAIVTIDAPTEQNEKICAKWYDQARRNAISLHPWNFAKTRALAPETTVPAFGYTRAFILPAEYIRIVQVGKTKQDFVSFYKDYSIEGGLLLINYDQDGSLPIVFTKDITSVVKYSPWFVDVQAHSLALLISPEVNRTQSEIDTLRVQANEALTNAKQLEGQESPVITIQNSKYRTGVQTYQKLGNPD